MNKKVMISSYFGNALEFYDFTIYGVFALAMAETYFPSSNPINGILASWGAFAAGFIMRPFGASFFGYMGDKFGRQRALSATILLMGLPTLIIGVLPSYRTIGILAPISVVLCRLLQGLCTGGEYNGAAIFAIEHGRGRKEGFISGLITSSCVFGALTATGLSALSLKNLDGEFSWRALFILGSLVSLIGYFIRNKVEESPEFKPSNNEDTYLSHQLNMIGKNSPSFILAIFSGGLNGVLSYTLFGFMNVYLSRYLGTPLADAMFANVFGLLAFMFFSPIGGIWMDKLGKYTYFSMAISSAIFVPIILFSIMGSSSLYTLIFIQIMYGVIVGIIAGPQHALLKSLFPPESRYSGVSFGFCLGMGFIGGFTPLVATFFIEKTSNFLVPGIIVSAAAVVNLYFLQWHRKRASQTLGLIVT